MCVCVCVREREREREIEGGRKSRPQVQVMPQPVVDGGGGVPVRTWPKDNAKCEDFPLRASAH